MKANIDCLSEGLCLIVEDQVATQVFLQEAVRSIFPSLKIITVRELREALAFLKERTLGKPVDALRLALVDLGLPDGSGQDLLKQLAESEPETKSVVVTMYGEDQFLFEALAAGAFGYVLKDDDADLIRATLEKLLRDEPPISPAIARRLLAHFRGPRIEAPSIALTSREKETLTLLARGLTVGEAAQSLGLSAQTVAGYVKTLYQKLHVSNRAEATKLAMRLGLA